MPEFWELASVLLASMFKFMVGVFLSIGYEFPFWVGVPATVAGAMLGVFVYIFFGEIIRGLLIRFMKRKHPFQNMPVRRRRMIVKVKKRFGLPGIAFLTPMVLTVPIGSIVAVALGYRWYKILLAMLISFSTWSLLVFTIYDLTGLDLRDIWAQVFG